MTNPEIVKLLDDLENKYEMDILYACEAGSRAYNVSTVGSDYDIRFIYVSPLPRYLSLTKINDTITFQKGKWDVQGWDLKKALSLASKSNPSLFEWLLSPIVYKEDLLVVNALQEMAQQQFSLKTLLAHYGNMAKRNLLSYANNKKGSFLFHAVRATLMAEKILSKGPHTINFPILMEQSDILGYAELRAVLYTKQTGKQKVSILQEKKLIEAIVEYWQKKENEISQLPDRKPSIHQLQVIFLSQLGIKG